MIKKLVRDKIPQIIKESNGTCKYHIADIDEFKKRICTKLDEELNEFIDDPCLDEAADMYEVLRTLLWAYDIDFHDVVTAAARKKEERGGFCEGVVLDHVDKIEQ